MKNLTVTHKENGKKMQISWNGKDLPSEDHIDQLFAKEYHKVRKPYDPLETTEMLRLNQVPKINNNSDSTDDGQSDKDNTDNPEDFLKYHDSLSSLSDNPDRFASSILHARKAKIDPEHLEMDLTNAGLDPERVKLGKELIRN